jgi:hypothetical protein
MQASPRAVTVWRRSSHSGDGNNCVEVARTSEGIGVRDSKNLDAGVIAVPAAQWRLLVEALRGR